MKDIIWEPYGEYLTESNITRFMKNHKIKDYEELVKKSTSDTEWFWDAALRDLGFEWYTPFRKLLDTSRGFPWAQWFIDGKINMTAYEIPGSDWSSDVCSSDL